MKYVENKFLDELSFWKTSAVETVIRHTSGMLIYKGHKDVYISHPQRE